MASDPRSPLRADHRLLQRLFSSTLRGKVEHVPAEFDKVSQLFVEGGGSWVRVFQGSPEDIASLKKTIKKAYEEGLLTKRQGWGA